MKQREEGKEKVMESCFHMGPRCRGLLGEDLTADGGSRCVLARRMGAGWWAKFRGKRSWRAACVLERIEG